MHRSYPEVLLHQRDRLKRIVQIQQIAIASLLVTSFYLILGGKAFSL